MATSMGSTRKSLLALSSVALALLAALLAAAFAAPTQAYAAKPTVTVTRANTGKVTIPLKSSYKLGAKVTKGKVKYRSSKPKIVSVSKKGVIKGKKLGKATITIKGTKGGIKRVRVIVVAKKKFKQVKSITAKLGKRKLVAGGKTKVKVRFKPVKASNKNVRFKSSRPKVATVSPLGVVKAKKAGTTKITVISCSNKKAKKTVKLTVKKAPVLHTVTFDSRGGTAVPVQRVKHGSTAKAPAKPTLANAKFLGWSKGEPSKGSDKAAQNEGYFDFSTKITKDVTLYAMWSYLKRDSNGKLDLGDLAVLQEEGKISYTLNDDGLSPRTIEGRFTDKKVSSASDAAAVLNEASSLFDSYIDANGNKVTKPFDAKPEEIVKQTPLSDGKEGSGLAFYRYCPKKDGIPVVGSQVILSCDPNGNVTGLMNAYDNEFNSLEKPATFVPESRAKEAAREFVINSIASQNDTGTIPDLQLDAQAQLIICNDTEAVDRASASNEPVGKPFYAYAVAISKCAEPTNPPAPGDDDDNTTPASDDENSSSPYATSSGDSQYEGLVEWTVYVDAVTNEVRKAFDCSARYESTSFAADDAQPNDDSNLPADDEEAAVPTTSIRGGSALSTQEDSWHDTTLRKEDRFGNMQTIDCQQWNDEDTYRFKDSKRHIIVHRIQTKTVTDDNGNTKTVPDYTQHPALVFGKDTYMGIAVTLETNAARAYDFYKNTFGRKSVDDKDSWLNVGYINSNQGTAKPNAYWNHKNNLIRFNEWNSTRQLFKAADTIGHEFTHGVSDYTVRDADVDESSTGFKYENESGALDEAYADIMGSFVEGKTDKDRWNHGEDSGKISRSLADPTKYGDPDHYKDRQTSSTDNGGVHTNSLIYSHAAYTMMTDSRTKLVARSTWARMFYLSLFFMTNTATFVDARHAVYLAANALNFSRTEQQAINDAFDSVGIEDKDRFYIELKWGKSPKDLDLHLIGPSLSGKGYVDTYWNNRYYMTNNVSKAIALLNWDERNCYGPETIVFDPSVAPDGRYYIMVYDSTNAGSTTSTALAKSGAYVRAKHSGYNYTKHIDASKKGCCWAPYYILVKNGKGVLYNYGGPVYGGNNVRDKIYSRF